jgi:hypothetical protein
MSKAGTEVNPASRACLLLAVSLGCLLLCCGLRCGHLSSSRKWTRARLAGARLEGMARLLYQNYSSLYTRV